LATLAGAGGKRQEQGERSNAVPPANAHFRPLPHGLLVPTASKLERIADECGGGGYQGCSTHD
jgi:hypothetical protein